MNKDVIYIEPEDDITDIIGKLKSAKQKVVALVPPKKLGVLRSAVNVKLIARTAVQSEKVAVIITADESMSKLALSAGIPIAKTLQSRPILPASDAAKAILDGPVTVESSSESPVEAKDSKSQAATVIDSLELESDLGPKSKPAAKKKSGLIGKVPDIMRYRKYIIAGSVLFVVLVGFLVWANTFAISAKIAVSVRTTADNFSELADFTLKQSESNASEGVFLLEEHKLEKESEIKFKPTGQKNLGEKASGTITVYAMFTSSMLSNKTTITIPAGTKFTYNKLDYLTSKSATLAPTNQDIVNGCENHASLINPYCQKSIKLDIVAAEGGEKYNTSDHSSGWTSSFNQVSIRGSSTISGGTDKVVTVVQQTDIDKAKELLSSVSETAGKSELMKKIGSGNIIIDSTFSHQEGKPVSTPKIGEEVKDGEEATLTAKTTFAIYTVDAERIKEFITAKTKPKIAEDQKIYSFDKPFIESYKPKDDKEKDKKYHGTAKVKASLQIGPKITHQDIMEKARGRKIGEVRNLLKPINGVSEVSVEVPYPWILSIPDDPNKVTIDLKVEK